MAMANHWMAVRLGSGDSSIGISKLTCLDQKSLLSPSFFFWPPETQNQQWTFAMAFIAAVQIELRMPFGTCDAHPNVSPCSIWMQWKDPLIANGYIKCTYWLTVTAVYNYLYTIMQFCWTNLHKLHDNEGSSDQMLINASTGINWLRNWQNWMKTLKYPILFLHIIPWIWRSKRIEFYYQLPNRCRYLVGQRRALPSRI